MKTTIQKIIFAVSSLTFAALFSCLAVLNGWFFYDLGGKIPLADNYTLAVPFLIMGMAVSVIASLTSMASGKIPVIAGLIFHAVSIGITYTSINFALDSQSSEVFKSEQSFKIADEQAALAEKMLIQSEKQVEAAKAGIGNAAAADLLEQQRAELDAAKSKPAYNSNGKYAGTVWEMTNGCTKATGFYAKNYAADCENINKTIPYKYKRMLVQVSEVGTQLVQGQKALEKQEKALHDKLEASKNHTPVIELPVLLDDKEQNKQLVTLLIALMFEIGLVILEWLLSGKIGAKNTPKTAEKAGTQPVQERYKPVQAPVQAGTSPLKAIIHLFGAKDLFSAIKAKNRTIARTRKELEKKEKELNKAIAELDGMRVLEGSDAMREMTSFHVSKIFKDAGERVTQADSAVIALVCRTYEPGGTLAIHKTYEAVKALAECKDARPSRKQIADAISKMDSVLIERKGEGKGTVNCWIEKAELIEIIGQLRIAS